MLLDRLKKDQNIQDEETDYLGGGFFLESGIYPFKLDMVYMTESAKKATALNIECSNPDGVKFKNTFYMTGNEDKGCKNTYIDKKTGDERYLPGFLLADSLCQLVLEKEIGDMDVEEKIANIYDFQEKKEIPTAVEAFPELMGKEVYVAVLKTTEDGMSLDAATKKYVPNGKVRTINTIEKFMRAADKKTLSEVKGDTDSQFYDKWEAKWSGVTKDTTTDASKGNGTAGAPVKDSAAGTPSLFA